MDPTASAHPDEHIIDEVIARHSGRKGALIPMLHDLQSKLGHVPAAADAKLAQALNLSVAEIRGVVSFYHDFRRELPARPVIRLCRAEACQARGVDRLD